MGLVEAIKDLDGAEPGSPRHAPSAQHRARRVALDWPRQRPGRRAASPRDARPDGRRGSSVRRGAVAERRRDRRGRARHPLHGRRAACRGDRGARRTRRSARRATAVRTPRWRSPARGRADARTAPARDARTGRAIVRMLSIVLTVAGPIAVAALVAAARRAGATERARALGRGRRWRLPTRVRPLVARALADADLALDPEPAGRVWGGAGRAARAVAAAELPGPGPAGLVFTL